MDIKDDLTRNLKGGTGTTHSPAPGLWEYHYDNLLRRTNLGWLEKLISSNKSDVSLHIKNVPGEMFNTYFKVRIESPTVNQLFSAFLHSDVEAVEMIESYCKNELDDTSESTFVSLRERFRKYLLDDNHLKPSDRGDAAEIIQNFFSYIFFYTCTDLVICHDVTLSNSDTKLDQQMEFLEHFDPANETSPNIYYAFTKFDCCVSDPQINYIGKQLRRVDDYWETMEENLKNIYNSKEFMSESLLKEIDNIMTTHAIVEKVLCKEEGLEILEHTYFICTNYSNQVKNRGFFQFVGEGHANDKGVWNDKNYFNNYYPLGAVELLIAIFHRNNILNFDELQIPFDSERFPMISTAYGFYNT
ncbi:MAG TPA: hypothetical protein VFE53_03240 [Mucilaginibacter sp.]|nr:hypothetical protein [Mucilaginibacter sp.]